MTIPCRSLATAVFFVTFSFFTTAVLAQGTTPGAALGTISISAQSTVYDPNIVALAFVPFDVYVMVDLDYADIGRPELNPTVGILAWEAGVNFPPEFNVLSANIRNVSLNVGSITNLIVGLSRVVVASQTPVDLVHYSVGYFAGPNVPTGVPITIGPASPSSFRPEAPGFAESTDVGECVIVSSGTPTNCLRSFAAVRNAVINCTTGCDPTTPEMLQVVIGDASLPQDGTVVVPVDAQVVLAKVVGVPADLSGFDLSLSWDPALASLQSVSVGADNSSWLVQANIGQGSVQISAANSQGLSLGASAAKILQLEFMGLGQTGVTTIAVDASSFFDSTPDPISAIVIGGSLDVIPCHLYDPTNDGVVNSADAIVALKIVTGLIVPDQLTLCSADVNQDGSVDTGDVVRILRRAVGLEKSQAVDAGDAGLALIAEAGRVRLHARGVAGAQGVLRYDADLLRVTDWSGGDASVLALVNTEQPGLVRFAMASGDILDAELEIRFENLRAMPGRVRLESELGFAVDGSPSQMQVDTREVLLQATTPKPSVSRLLGASPNPFNPRTDIRYHLERSSDVQLSIYDAAGRAVQSWMLPAVAAGDHAVSWNGIDAQGRQVASGVYFVRMNAGAVVDHLRITLVK